MTIERPSVFDPLEDERDAKPLALPDVVRAVAINFSGNSGKTTMCRHLLRPVMPAARSFRIASTLSYSADAGQTVLRPRKFEEAVIALCAANEHVIIDIDAADTKAALKELADVDASHRWVDVWLVPCMRRPSVNAKMYRDTVATLKALLELGTDPGRIAVVKNGVNDVSTMEHDFLPLIETAQALQCRIIESPVLDLDLYCELDGSSLDLDALASDSTDYRAAFNSTSVRSPERDQLVIAERRRRHARTALRNLTRVRAELLGQLAARPEGAAGAP